MSAGGTNPSGSQPAAPQSVQNAFSNVNGQAISNPLNPYGQADTQPQSSSMSGPSQDSYMQAIQQMLQNFGQQNSQNNQNLINGYQPPPSQNGYAPGASTTQQSGNNPGFGGPFGGWQGMFGPPPNIQQQAALQQQPPPSQNGYAPGASTTQQSGNNPGFGGPFGGWQGMFGPPPNIQQQAALQQPSTPATPAAPQPTGANSPQQSMQMFQNWLGASPPSAAPGAG